MVPFVRALATLYGLDDREAEGQGLIEYGLLVSLIAVGIIFALIFMHRQVNAIFSRVGNSLT